MYHLNLDAYASKFHRLSGPRPDYVLSSYLIWVSLWAPIRPGIWLVAGICSEQLAEMLRWGSRIAILFRDW